MTEDLGPIQCYSLIQFFTSKLKNPTTLLPDIIAEHRSRFPKALKRLAADMGFSSKENCELLKARGVRLGMA